MRALVIAAFMMLGSVNAAAGQMVVEENIDVVVNDLLADRELEFVVVRMQTFPHQGGPRRYADSRVVADLRRMGLRGLTIAQNSTPAQRDAQNRSYVAAECSTNEFLHPDAPVVSVAISIFIEIWDHVRGSSLTAYRAVQIMAVGQGAYSRRSFEEECADLLSDPLIRLGFERQP